MRNVISISWVIRINMDGFRTMFAVNSCTIEASVIAFAKPGFQRTLFIRRGDRKRHAVQLAATREASKRRLLVSGQSMKWQTMLASIGSWHRSVKPATQSKIWRNCAKRNTFLNTSQSTRKLLITRVTLL